MKIPDTVLKTYNCLTLEEYRFMFPEIENKEEAIYRSFLNKTDHIPLKLIEGSISSADVAEELKYREIARQEIAMIEGKPYEPKTDKMTLDERTAILEEEGLEATIDHECRIALLELGVTEL